ncbi:MAG: alpha/beta fold hydrolase [Anaerolineae bacterium]
MIVLKTSKKHTIKQTHTLDWKYGPIAVDVWHPQESSGVAPIMLVHGWGGTGSYWEPIARELSKTTPVIVPDLPGTGRSQPLRHTQNLFDQVENIKFILDSLQVDCVQLVGHSMGGAMSVMVAADQPERVQCLVLTSVTFFKTQAQVDFYRNLMQFFRVSMHFRPSWLVAVPGVAQMMASQYFHRVPDDPAILRQGLNDYLNLDRKTAIACADDATDSRIRAAGQRVQARTMLIAARQDNMMPKENVDFTAEIIGDCQVRWIDECGHLPMVEKTNEYQALLEDFLTLYP